jgi:hypothetical protein
MGAAAGMVEVRRMRPDPEREGGGLKYDPRQMPLFPSVKPFALEPSHDVIVICSSCQRQIIAQHHEGSTTRGKPNSGQEPLNGTHFSPGIWRTEEGR